MIAYSTSVRIGSKNGPIVWGGTVPPPVRQGGALMDFVKDDGGRAQAGFRGDAGDCVTRAIAIATGLPYADVYRAMAEGTGSQRASSRTKKRGRTARDGINVTRKWFRDYMASIGWRWVPTMTIGSGCTVHLTDGELPAGRLIVSVSKHYTAVIDGVVHDTHNPQRENWAHVGGDTHPDGWSKVLPTDKTNGDIGQRNAWRLSRRCVYGYWVKA